MQQQENKHNPPSGKQAIHCNVKSCTHHGSQDYCALNSISVAACSNGNTGKPADESMCASYETGQLQ
jgi:SET domain-containing protein